MSQDITALRRHLFDQLQALRATSIDNPEALKAELSKASGVAELAKVITDTAKVEVDYLRTTGGSESSFIENATKALPPGIAGVTRHRLQG